jgi:hypothetical protein
MPKFLTLIASHLPSTSQLNSVYFERERIELVLEININIHNNLWQFFFKFDWEDKQGWLFFTH